MPKNITKAKHRFPLRELRHLGGYFSRLWPVFFLALVSGVLIFLNYEPGTLLTGWDNLHPEFDIAENLRRTFFSVWQEYRGPGLLGGMAHAADLPRVLFIALLLLLKVPLDLIRYLTTFIPLVLGPIGVYLLFYDHLFKGKLDARSIQFASFLGGLYYLLNLNTLQTFFVPFETFTAFYGALPWLLYFTLAYLTHPSRLRLFVLFLVSFLAAPSFYVETIFLVFFVSILPFFLEFLRAQKSRLKHLKTVTFSLLGLVLPHLFWLLPVAFFVLTSGHVPQEAKNNLLSSPETYARNLQFATLQDTALLKGYLFNYLDLGQDNKYTYLLTVWRSHLKIPIVNLLGFLSFALVLTGLYYSLKKKFTWTKSFMGVLALCLFFLLGGGLLVNNKIPLIGELFRAPFTKFSIVLSLAYAFFFSIGTIFLLDLFTFLHTRLTYYLTLFTVAFSLILFMSPAFSGNLVYPALRRSLPQSYLDLFSYMQAQDPSTRVASFPQFSFWGWESYDWGYRGSGFLWYGLRQPLLDRAFDPWDKNSERYYEEMSTALYSGDQQAFESVLDKYSVNWLLIDEHLTLPENATDSGLVTLKKFLTTSKKVTLAQNFDDKLVLYKVALSQPTVSFISVGSPVRLTHPLASLSLRPNTDWTTKGDYLNLTQALSAKAGDTLTLPSLTDSEALLPVRVEYRKTGGSLDLRLTPVIPTVFADNSQIDLQATPLTINVPGTLGTGFVLELNHEYFELQLPAEIDNFTDYYPLTTLYLPSQGSFSLSLYSNSEIALYDLTDSLSKAEPQQCYLIKPNHKVEKITDLSGISLLGTDVVGCLSAPLPYLSSGNLISLAFTYSSPTLTPGSVNISGHNLEAQNLPQALEAKGKPTRARLFVPTNGAYQQVNLVLEASETKSVREINYSDIEASVLPRIYATAVSLPAIPEKQITLKSDLQKIQISLPNTATQLDLTETPAQNSLFPESQNCDQFNLGQVVKKVTSEGFLYQSLGATECDTLSLRQLPHSLSYLLTFTLEPKRGLTPTICLENHTSRRCDVQERLLAVTMPQSVIQPVKNPHEAPGYTLHLYNQSFGTRLTSNLISSLSIRPLPLGFLEGIITSSPAVANQASLSATSHPFPFLYTATVENGQNAVLNLYQTRSSSWKAITVSSNDTGLNSWLLVAIAPLVAPFLPQLTPATPSVWHNSWTLPPGTTSVLLVYLPQYLEFVGLLVLLVTPVVLLLSWLLRRRP